MRRIYVAGPMTGLPESNYPAFNRTAALLMSQGWHVENPADNPAPPDGHPAPWSFYMRAGLAQLLTCDAICLLSGWRDSVGAQVEAFIARTLGMPVYELVDEVLVPCEDYWTQPAGWGL